MFDLIYMHLLSRKVVKVVNVRRSCLRIHDNAVRETGIRREVEVWGFLVGLHVVELHAFFFFNACHFGGTLAFSH